MSPQVAIVKSLPTTQPSTVRAKRQPRHQDHIGSPHWRLRGRLEDRAPTRHQLTPCAHVKHEVLTRHTRPGLNPWRSLKDRLSVDRRKATDDQRPRLKGRQALAEDLVDRLADAPPITAVSLGSTRPLERSKRPLLCAHWRVQRAHMCRCETVGLRANRRDPTARRITWCSRPAAAGGCWRRRFWYVSRRKPFTPRLSNQLPERKCGRNHSVWSCADAVLDGPSRICDQLF